MNKIMTFICFIIICLFVMTGCMGETLPDITSNAIGFDMGSFHDTEHDDALFGSIEYNGRTYIAYGTSNNKYKKSDIESCVGYIIQNAKVIDLFAGAGGLSLGFMQTQKYDIKVAFENSPYMQQTYRLNHPGVDVQGDVCAADYAEIKKQYNGIDVVIGGPPCQGFSNANRQRNHAISQNNMLVKQYLRAILELQPKAFVMENVSMLRSEVHRFFMEKGDVEQIQRCNIPVKTTYLRLLDAEFVFAGALDIVQDIHMIEEYLWPESDYAELNVIYKASKNPAKMEAALIKHQRRLLCLAEKYTADNRESPIVIEGKKAYLTLSVMTLILSILLTGCSGKNENSRSVVYDDMKTAFEQSGLLSANIGIFSKTETDGSISYGEGGSGVIFKKEGGMYYALTAAHVVSVENAQLLVFTTNTEMKSESIPGVDLNVLTPETYDAMYTAEIEYVSKRDDLAIISFQADEDLTVITLAEEDPKKDDRIICVGNPQNEWFAVSYGKITSGIEKFGETQGFPSNAMKHSAYIQVGSSGGAAFNEQMQLAGTTPGGSFSLDGKTFNYGVMIPISEIKICLDEWEKQ